MRVFFLLRLFLLVLPFAGRAGVNIPPLKYEQRQLANGLQFIWLEDHSAPTVAVQVWYRVGSKDDPPGRSGFAHLFEHMMFKSTKRMPSEAFDRLTEDVGGENNAFTQDDVTVYHETVPANHLQRLIWAEAERLASLTVDVRNFTLEREVVKEEFRQRVLAEPYGEFNEFIQKTSWVVHPYRRPTIGNIEELDAANLAEVRDFHATFYRPDNAVLIVVGDFVPERLQAWVDECFGPVPRPEKAIPRVTEVEPERTAARTVRQHDEKVPLPALAINWLVPKLASAETAAIELLASVLGGGESSRLHQALVYRQQLAQSAGAYADQRADAGLLAAEIVLASGVSVEKAAAAFAREIAQIVEQGISPAELETARNRTLAERLRDRETHSGKAMALGAAATLLGNPERANETLAELAAVTVDDVQAVARRWLAERNRLTIEYLPAGAKKGGAR